MTFNKYVDKILVDKALDLGSDYNFDETGDIRIVSDDQAYLQAAQNRCISILTSWLHDEWFGNDLQYYIRENSPRQLTNDIANGYVQQSLQPMIDDGRIDSIFSVTVTDVTDTSVSIEVIVTIGTNRGTISFEVTNF